MTYEIRAMSFAEILDTGFGLVRDHFFLLSSIGLVLYGPIAVMQEVAGAATKSPEQVGLGTAFAVLLSALLVFALSPIAGGAMTLAVGSAYRGQPTSLEEAYRGSLTRALALVGTYLLVGLGVFVGFLLLVLPGIYFGVAWMLATQIVMLEGIAGVAALTRSHALVRGHLRRALGVASVAMLLTASISVGLQLLVSEIPIVRAVASAVAQSVGMAFYTSVCVALYFDLRCRKEGFDSAHLALPVEGSAASQDITFR